ncbi:putative glycoside hydrolase family 105 protein [Diaporthe ampelina]|uniref:Putative glycoside hydrolase family 105 protein n=1 Tax=Diaporthe ampelina TaxID=1214573 RepID=A0A0G2FWI6_9PEZI|nr:putative glycoside hydrolase family 105 protein [Diaporthe ampelina]
MAAITALVETYNITRNPSYLPVIEDWGDWAMYNLTRTPDGGWQHLTTEPHNGEMWIDILMMVALPLAKIGVLTSKAEYKKDAIFQFRNHVK